MHYATKLLIKLNEAKLINLQYQFHCMCHKEHADLGGDCVHYHEIGHEMVQYIKDPVKQ